MKATDFFKTNFMNTLISLSSQLIRTLMMAYTLSINQNGNNNNKKQDYKPGQL